MTERLRLVVLGMMGCSPFGGQTWLYLNWIRGLQRLGHDVYYVEDHILWPYDPLKDSLTDDCEYAVDHVAKSMAQIGAPDSWAFNWSRRRECWGMSEDELRHLYKSCDAVLNIVGATELHEGHPAMDSALRVLVETDPVTHQLWLANGDDKVRRQFERHDHLVTYGENYGEPDCGVPLGEFEYSKTRQPIDLDLWPYAYDGGASSFTTIANYRHKGKDKRKDVAFGGEVYLWSKHHEWEKFINLPRMTSQRLEIATSNRSERDRELLESRGWRVVPAFEMSLDAFGEYQQYFRSSRAEFTVAKDQNVRLRSGWFGERDACYLASGKPVVAQDTGFGNVLPTGEGLFAFNTLDEALFAIDEINFDYEKHSRAARSIAEEYFEAGAVASRLLADVGLGT